MRTSVVVVTYRPTAWLARSVASVAQQADEVVVVDNASDGPLAREVAAMHGAVYVAARTNLGFAGGVNLGIRATTGDVIALLNDDAVADPGWIECSTAALADVDVGVVAPKLLLAPVFAELRFEDDPWHAPGDPRPLGRRIHEVTVDGAPALRGLLGGVHRLEQGDLGGVERTWRWTSGPDAVYVPLPEPEAASTIRVDGEPVAATRTVSLVNNAGSYLSQEGHAGDRGWEAPDDGQFDGRRPCFSACGAAMAFTRATAEHLGRFPERFFAYYEDVDFCWRARLAGLDVIYEPGATVRHARSVTSGGEAEARVRFLSGRNRIHTLARNAPLPVLRRQVHRLRNPDLPPELGRAARRRVPMGLVERAGLRRRWRRSPRDVWNAWAGVDERWDDPGRVGPRAVLPPRLEFGD